MKVVGERFQEKVPKTRQMRRAEASSDTGEIELLTWRRTTNPDPPLGPWDDRRHKHFDSELKFRPVFRACSAANCTHPQSSAPSASSPSSLV